MSKELSQEQKEKVKEIIAKAVNINVAIIEDENTIDQLGGDSLHVVEIIIELEKEFDCNIPDAQAEEVKSVNDCYKVLEQNIN